MQQQLPLPMVAQIWLSNAAEVAQLILMATKLVVSSNVISIKLATHGFHAEIQIKGIGVFWFQASKDLRADVA